MAYLFNDYWEYIGPIKSFFEANLALAAQVPLQSRRPAGTPHGFCSTCNLQDTKDPLC